MIIGGVVDIFLGVDAEGKSPGGGGAAAVLGHQPPPGDRLRAARNGRSPG